MLWVDRMGVSGLALALGVLCLFVSVDPVISYYGNSSCYYCSDTGSNPDCQSYKALKKANDKQDEKDQLLLRNCTGTENYCMIEMYIKQGAVYSYIRDCTANSDDSFSFLKEGRLHYVRTDNITTCTFDKDTMGQMCLTICEGKQCNGPLSGGRSVHYGHQAVYPSIGLLIMIISVINIT